MLLLTIVIGHVHQITLIKDIELVEILITVIDHWHELHAIGVGRVEVVGAGGVPLVRKALVHRAIGHPVEYLDDLV